MSTVTLPTHSTARPRTPSDVRRSHTMTRIRRADADARYLAGRRANARKNGYPGPLTRAEASAMALAQLADLANGR